MTLTSPLALGDTNPAATCVEINANPLVYRRAKGVYLCVRNRPKRPMQPLLRCSTHPGETGPSEPTGHFVLAADGQVPNLPETAPLPVPSMTHRPLATIWAQGAAFPTLAICHMPCAHALNRSPVDNIKISDGNTKRRKSKMNFDVFKVSNFYFLLKRKATFIKITVEPDCQPCLRSHYVVVRSLFTSARFHVNMKTPWCAMPQQEQGLTVWVA